MIRFKEDDNEYWFDPEEGETNYKGDNPSIVSTLENIKSVASIEEAVSVDDPDLDVIGPSESSYSPQKARSVVESLLKTRQGVSIIEDEKSAPQVVEGPLEGNNPPVYDDYVVEKRVYVDDPSEVPEGATVHEGERGGLYYDESEATDFQQFQRNNNIERLKEHNYPEEQVDEAVETAQRVFEKSGDIFETWLDSAQQVGSVTGASHRVKSVGSALEKALDRKEDKYGTAESLNDWHGTQIKMETVDEVNEVFEVFQEEFDIIEAKDKMDPDSRYRANHLIAEVEGETVELQIKQEEHSKIAQASHALTYKRNTAPVDQMETLDEPVPEGSQLEDDINECLTKNADFIQGLQEDEPECDEEAQAVIREFFEVSGL